MVNTRHHRRHQTAHDRADERRGMERFEHSRHEHHSGHREHHGRHEPPYHQTAHDRADERRGMERFEHSRHEHHAHDPHGMAAQHHGAARHHEESFREDMYRDVNSPESNFHERVIDDTGVVGAPEQLRDSQPHDGMMIYESPEEVTYGTLMGDSNEFVDNNPHRVSTDELVLEGNIVPGADFKEEAMKDVQEANARAILGTHEQVGTGEHAAARGRWSAGF